MLRFSLLTLLVAVLIVALFCAALANATEPWRDAAKLALWLFLLTSLTAAIASRDRTRAIASGMAVFGLGFYFLEEGYRSQPAFVDSTVDWAFVAVHGLPPEPIYEAPPRGLVDAVEESRYPSTTIEGFMRQPRPGNGIVGDDALYEARESYKKRKVCFAQIACVGVALLLSVLGGGVGMIFYTRSHSGANKTPS